MKTSDLHREWARVLDMCEGTIVNPFSCWKYNGEDRWFNPIHNGEFDGDPNKHEFAITILEDKPVFVGDKLYAKSTGESIVVCESHLFLKGLSWNKPNKKFILNGQELPCPVKLNGSVKHSFMFGVRAVSFDTFEDCTKVYNAINKLLHDNTI